MDIQTSSASNVSTMTPADRKRIWVLRGGVAAGSAVVLALAAPIIWGAASAGAGLLVLGTIAAVGIGAIQALPLLGQKWENKLLAARKAEARQHPIEQLQNYLRFRAESVRAFRDAVSAIGAQVETMNDLIIERKRAKPDYDASRKERAVAKMRDAHRELTKKYLAGEAALADLREIIEDKKFDWKFGQVGQIALAQMNSAQSDEDLVQTMLADESFDSVRDNFNSVFSAIDLASVSLNNNKELSFDDGMTIDLSSIQIPVGQKVRS